jgi:hypothetical protein
MRSRRVNALRVSLLVWLVAMSVPTSAHHSMAMYDLGNTISITGVVTRIELKNPHSLFYLAVTGEDGKQVEWMLEAQPLVTLLDSGWSQTTMQVGDKVTAVGSPTRNGRPALLVRAIQLPDGRTIRT